MPVLKQIFDAKRDHRRCLPADVDDHFKKIEHWMPYEEVDVFKKRMLHCIEEGTAWHTDNTFLYYQMQDRRIAHGIAIFGMDYPIEMLALFIGAFSIEDNDTHIIRFKLHPGKFVSEYKTLLTTISTKRSRQIGSPLVIRIDLFKEKIKEIYKQKGLK